MTGGEQPERLEGQSVSASFFRMLGVAPVLGRDFQRVRGCVSTDPTLSSSATRLWQRLFHGDPAILGRAIKLDGDTYTVIGVMPHAFEDVLSLFGRHLDARAI